MMHLFLTLIREMVFMSRVATSLVKASAAVFRFTRRCPSLPVVAVDTNENLAVLGRDVLQGDFALGLAGLAVAARSVELQGIVKFSTDPLTLRREAYLAEVLNTETVDDELAAAVVLEDLVICHSRSAGCSEWEKAGLPADLAPPP